MGSAKLFGAVLLVVGLILLGIGINATDSFADQTKEFFTGKFTDRTTWLLLGGAACTVFGLGALLVPRRSP